MARRNRRCWSARAVAIVCSAAFPALAEEPSAPAEGNSPLVINIYRHSASGPGDAPDGETVLDNGENPGTLY